jgi:hypothetical protein
VFVRLRMSWRPTRWICSPTYSSARLRSTSSQEQFQQFPLAQAQDLENLRELSAGHELRAGLWNRAASEQELAPVEHGYPGLDA